MGILSGFGWGGVVAASVWLILTGRIVPKSVVEQVTDLAAKEALLWKAAFDKSEEARIKERELLDKAIAATQATAAVVREFNTVAAQIEKKASDDS